MSKTSHHFSFEFFILLNLLIVSIKCFDSVSDYRLVSESDERWYWNKEEYPNPHETPPYCRRTKPSFVCDPDRVIATKDANRLDDLINSLRNVSICLCRYCPPNESRGLSLAIALAKDIYKEYNVKDLQNANIFADFIRRKWNFGICDNNVVVVVVASDNQVAFSLGSVASKILPDFIVEDMVIENKMNFINENYSAGLENIIKSFASILRKKIQYSEPFKETDSTEKTEQSDESSHTALIVGLIIGFVLFVAFMVFLLIYLKKRFSEDMDSFQFKGMLSKGYWLNRNERLKSVSVRPIIAKGGVYEPCSIEEHNQHNHTNDTDARTDPIDPHIDSDQRLRQKLSQISDESTSSDDEEIQVIEHNEQNRCQPLDASHRQTSGNEQSSPESQLLQKNIATSDDIV